MGLYAGDLREVIDIQSVTEGVVPGGGTSKVWATVFEGVRAKIEPISGGEAFAQGIARNTQFYQVTIRWRMGVSPRNRIVWNGMFLNIRTCGDPDMTREALELRVESGAAEPA